MDPQSADLRLATRWMNDSPIIMISGEIDICTAPAVHAYLLEAADMLHGIAPGKGIGDMVVDLSAVTFMDACGLSTLLRADHHARRAGRRLRLAGPSTPVARLLAITRLDLYFDLYPTSQAATTHPIGIQTAYGPTRTRRARTTGS
jgi:anti-sigma B factor antagonist